MPTKGGRYTQQEVATALDLRRSTIGYYASLGAPVGDGPEAVKVWLAAGNVRGNRSRGLAREDERLRREKLKAEVQQRKADATWRTLKVDQISGKLIEIEVAADEIRTQVAGWVQLLRRLPVEIASLIPDQCPHCGQASALKQQLRGEIDRLVYRVLEDMSAQAES